MRKAWRVVRSCSLRFSSDWREEVLGLGLGLGALGGPAVREGFRWSDGGGGGGGGMGSL